MRQFLSESVFPIISESLKIIAGLGIIAAVVLIGVGLNPI